MAILKLKPACKDYIWGGHRLVDDFGIEYDGDICAEAWLLSCHRDGESFVSVDGEEMTLGSYIDRSGKEILGSNCDKYGDFPILIKLIDARNPLSIQVHPDEAYARVHEEQHGKTEMWYILDANEGAFIYQGFSKEITEAEFEKRIADNTLEEVLNKVFVKKGDVIFITPGCLHAIGGGVLLAEIQQSSNVTYRIYDYGRVGTDGKTRPLHIRQALDVTKLSKPDKLPDYGKYLLNCEFFNVERAVLSEDTSYHTDVDENSFVSVIVVDGEIELSCGIDKAVFRKGESAFVPAGAGDLSATGDGEILITRVS